MKFKYCFSLVVILIIIFSLATVVASENITDEAHYLGDVSPTLAIDSQESANEDLNGIDESPEILNDGGESTDLSVRIDVTNTYQGNEFNRAGFEVPWTITARVTGGTALNAKVHITLSDDLELISNTPSAGSFNSINGIWDIGDLTSSNNATLKILTKLKKDGKFTVTANATSDSQDINFKNNYRSLSIQSGSSKSGSNITETTLKKAESIHDNKHYGSFAKNGVEKRQNSNDKSKTSDSKDAKTNSKEDSKSHGRNDVSEQSVGVFSVSKSLSGPVSNVIDSDDEESDESGDINKHIEAILPAYDYGRIATIIFALFLIIFVAIVGYGKIKS